MMFFLKDLPRTLFWGRYSQLWEDFRPKETNTLLIDDKAKKGALCVKPGGAIHMV
jgi:hypothetical protein